MFGANVKPFLVNPNRIIDWMNKVLRLNGVTMESILVMDGKLTDKYAVTVYQQLSGNKI